MNKFKSYGFTLVEVLVVLAITIVLMGLLLIPIMKTLEANRMTAAFTNAQQNSRKAMEMIRKDISEAMYVADSSASPMLLPVNGLVDKNGNSVNKPVVMHYAVINLVMPKTEFYCSNPDHSSQYPRTFARGENYKTGGRELAKNACPYCGSEEFVSVTPKIPIEKGSTVVRYFLGLTDNESIMTCSDANDIESWTVNSGMGWLPDSGTTNVEGDENPLILYRAEFDPASDNNLFPEEYSLEGLSEDSEEYKNILYRRMTDANVFYCDGCSEHWKSICENVGMLEGMDLALCSDDDYTEKGFPFRVKNSVSFSPASIAGEAPVMNSSTTYSEDNQGFPPSTFRTKYKLMNKNMEVDVVRTNPENGNPLMKWVMKNNIGSYSYYGNIYKCNPDDINPDTSDSNLIFDVNNYMFANHSVIDFNQDMAFTCDKDNGIVDFAMNPDLDNISFSQDNLTYIPERDIYEYKFMPYKNATVVPGSESVVFYNAYWTDEYGKSISDLFYNYTQIKNHAEKVKYQRAPYSQGFLNFNQYLIDYEKGCIYWRPLVSHNWGGVYPQSFDDIPEISSYKIQFNKVSDKVTVSYMTNEVIDVNVNMRAVWDTFKSPRSSVINERVIVGNSLK